MKANELMIGDWVYNKNIEKPMQVYPMMLSQMFRRTPDATTEDYNIFPVPLTVEILEKNGIKWLCTEPSGRETYCCNEPVVQCTYIPNSGWLINVGACGSIKVRFVEVSKIQYVHQLQHALRLCGIEKEIEL